MPEHSGDRVPLPILAMIVNVQTPYRIHLHLRLAREVPEVRLASLFTHDQGDQPWAKSHIEEINPVYFGPGHALAEQGRPRWLLRDWAKGGRVIRWLKSNSVGAVVISGYNDVTRLRVIAWCRRNKLPCFLTADSNSRGDLAAGVRRLVKKQLVTRVVRSVRGVLVCGKRGAEYFARYGASPTDIFISPPEPEYALIDQVQPAAIDSALARFGLDRARKRFVVCGRLIEAKRIDLAIDAFQAIAAERPDFDLLVIGDGPLRSMLEARVVRGLRDRVQFMGFIGDQTLISALYKGSHVFVLPSTYEPWGLVVNESAAAGLALVCSDAVGAAPELVREGVNGRTFPAGDLDGLIACMREASDEAHLARYRAASPEVVREWRRQGDPVEGIRKALRVAGVRMADTAQQPDRHALASA